MSAIAADQGGAATCSEAKLQLIRRAAALSVQLEDLEARMIADGKPINVTEYATLTSTPVRVISRLGIKRVPRDVSPTPSDILQGPPHND